MRFLHELILSLDHDYWGPRIVTWPSIEMQMYSSGGLHGFGALVT
jgi:hypothetical protein